MNLLFSIDDNYVHQFETTLFSISMNSDLEDLDIYLLQKEKLVNADHIQQFVESLGYNYHPVIMGEVGFDRAPVSKQYPETIYYRLLAHEFLPEDVHQVLYLDADILCLNDFSSLQELDMTDMCFAACSHSTLTTFQNRLNQVRLKTESPRYYNSGIMVMNLDEMRKTVKKEDIFDYIDKHHKVFVLPDQDIINGLYWDKIISLPDVLYNYDYRFSFVYEAVSNNEYTPTWVLDNTVFVHFCGKEKPWNPKHNGRFSFLWKHYSHLTDKYVRKHLTSRKGQEVGKS